MKKKSRCAMVAEAIKDEASGAKFYDRMAKKFPEKASSIRKIANDERRHLKTMRKLRGRC